MKKLTAVLAAVLALGATAARAEEKPASRPFSISPYVGAFIPTGDQRDILDDAVQVGLTLSYDVHPNVAVVGSFSWAPTKAKGIVLSDRDLDLFQYDLGVQGQYPVVVAGDVTLRPFLGVGAGARTYSFRQSGLSSETDFAAYVSAGAKAEYKGFELGLTARDYLTAFDGLQGTESSTARNDLSLFASVGMRF